MLNQTNGGFLISQLKQVQGRIFERLLDRAGIREFNGAQGRILFVLWRSGAVPIMELARQTGLAKTTLTGMLDRMEAADLVRRSYDRADRRQVLIWLTPRAENLKADYDRVSREMNERFYRGFSDDEILRFEDTLRRILQNLLECENE